jgi:Cu/Ag efflux pump CusA
MFDAIISASLRHRWVVSPRPCPGGRWALRGLAMPLDVLPELSAPSVTVVTEANGLAPEEVEQLVTFPSSRRSTARRAAADPLVSAIGISLIWVEFDWDVDPLAGAPGGHREAGDRAQRPAPGDRAAAGAGLLDHGRDHVRGAGRGATRRRRRSELRDTAEWSVRRRLLGPAGIAQVVPIGGAVRQVEVVLRPTA